MKNGKFLSFTMVHKCKKFQGHSFSESKVISVEKVGTKVGSAVVLVLKMKLCCKNFLDLWIFVKIGRFLS